MGSMIKSDKSHVLKLVTMRYAIGLNSFQKYIPTVLASDVSDETVAAIMENLDQMDGVDIAEDSLRRYTDSKYLRRSSAIPERFPRRNMMR